MLDEKTLAYFKANHAEARRRFFTDPTKCYQRHIRELYEELEGRVSPCSADCYNKCSHLDGYTVKQITREQAETIILKYEWLAGDPMNKSPMGRGISACYGLFSPEGELMGANCLGKMGGEIGNICGELNADKTVCLMRGACVPYAPRNAASFFTRNTCRLAREEYKWAIFFAYSDTQNASEVGTIYQALGWFYFGDDLGRGKGSHHSNFISPDGTQKVTSYALNHDSERKFLRSLGWDESKGRMRPYLKSLGWKEEKEYGKKKWGWFEGTPSEKRALKSQCRYPLDLPYPKNRAERKESKNKARAATLSPNVAVVPPVAESPLAE